MRALLTVAHLTLHDARRRRIVAAALICGTLLLALFGTGLFAVHREMTRGADASFVERQALLTALTLAGFYAVNFLGVLFAVLLPVDTLSGEVESGVMQTIAAKPIARAHIVLGKWLAHTVIVAAYLLMLSGGIVLLAWTFAGFIPVNLGTALPPMLLQAIVLLAVSIAGGTRFSTVTNGVVALGFYGIAFLGGWVEQIGGFGGLDSARLLGIAVSLISPTDALWRLASFRLQSPAVRDLGPLMFANASVPTPLMVWWAAGFTVVVLLVAVKSFARRPL